MPITRTVLSRRRPLFHYVVIFALLSITVACIICLYIGLVVYPARLDEQQKVVDQTDVRVSTPTTEYRQQNLIQAPPPAPVLPAVPQTRIPSLQDSAGRRRKK